MPSSNRISFFPIRPGSTGTATVSRRPALPCLTVEPRSRTGSSPRAELPGPSSLPRDIRPAESCKIVSHKFMPAISPMSRGDSPLGHPVQLLTISAWLLVIPSGRARETICHHEASSVQTKPERPPAADHCERNQRVGGALRDDGSTAGGGLGGQHRYAGPGFVCPRDDA